MVSGMTLAQPRDVEVQPYGPQDWNAAAPVVVAAWGF